jgi:hypothetical protein
MAKTYKSAMSWLLSLLGFESKAKIHVFCIDCESKNALSKRDWQGRIIEKGLHESLNALCTRIRHRYKYAPLMSRVLLGLVLQGNAQAWRCLWLLSGPQAF